MKCQYIHQTGLMTPVQVDWVMEERQQGALSTSVCVTSDPSHCWEKNDKCKKSWDSISAVYRSESLPQVKKLRDDMALHGWQCSDCQSGLMMADDFANSNYFLCVKIYRG